MTKCFVPKCCTGYDSDRKRRKLNNEEVPHFFRPPNEEALIKWSNIIRRRDRPLTKKDAICALHFREEFISREKKHKIKAGLKRKDGQIADNNTYEYIKRMVPVLLPGAVPTIFQGYPSYFQDSWKEKSPKERNGNVKELITVTPSYAATTEETADSDTLETEPESVYIDNTKAWRKFVNLPSENWVVWPRKDRVAFVNGTFINNIFTVLKAVSFLDSNISEPLVQIRNNFSKAEHCQTVTDVEKLLISTNEIKLCMGTGIGFSDRCLGSVPLGRKTACSFCAAEKKMIAPNQHR